MARCCGAGRDARGSGFEKLEAAVSATVASERFKQASERIGCLPAFLPADEFADFIRHKDQEIASIMEEFGIKKP